MHQGTSKFLIRTGPLKEQTGKTRKKRGVEISGDKVEIPKSEELGHNAKYVHALFDTEFLTKHTINIHVAEFDKRANGTTSTLTKTDPSSWLVYVRGKPQTWNPITYRKPTDEEVAHFKEMQEAQKPAAKARTANRRR